ncbi:MAG: glycine cleavage system protein GcvH [Candidatus Euphemobacter frigidus]|nr:glycine cleavage system protein GcvH [Candidatus Euphemobacter frigidus]MDP8276369.1 glycine cleavage system protein GcvH [Candidatus Euphemobacter frigidus]
MNPEDLLFTKDHEWIESGKSPARIGISDYAQKELTDIVYVELPEPGTEVEKGASLVTLESVKATSDVYAPAPGKITAVNSDLEDNPQKINESPYGEGWLVELEISDSAPLDELMDYAAYEKYLKEEEV